MKTLRICITDGHGDELSYSKGTTTTFSRVFNVYAARKHVPVTALFFSIAGVGPIDVTSTPISLQLQNNALIRCRLNMLRVRIRDENGNTLKVGTTQTAPLSQVFEAYAARQHVRVTSLFFSFGCVGPIDETSTPLSLQLEDQDQIDCCPSKLFIVVRGLSGSLKMTLSPTTKMSRLFKAFAARMNVPVTYLVFSKDGVGPIDKRATPLSLHLQDCDQIDCVLRSDPPQQRYP